MYLLVIINLAGKLASVLLFRSDLSAALALWLIPDFLLAYHLFAPWAQGLVRTHRRFITDRREVWLTIDDGPDPDDTPQILSLLAEHDARATFFVIGQKADTHPRLINTIESAGHEVAHHTHTHPLVNFWCASPARVARELDDALTALHRSGSRPTRFRAPAGIKNLSLARALRRRGLTSVGWSARGLELWPGDAGSVANRVLRGLAPGAILLLHEGASIPPAIRVHAIRHTLEQLRAQGYRCIVPRPDQLAD